MNNIDVSIIIPAYNAEDTIYDTVDSLLKQTLNNIEIIIIDDGSVDKTSDIVKMLGNNNKIKYVYQNNKGVSAARNKGIELAQGKYIGFVDADDIVNKEMFEKLFSKAIEDNADMVICGRVDIESDGKETVKLPRFKENKSNIYKSPNVISDITMFIWDKIYRTDIIKNNNILFDESKKYAEDFLFLFEFLLYSRIISVTNEALYYYKVRRDGAATNSYNENILDIPKVIEKVIWLSYEKGIINECEQYIWYIAQSYYIRRYKDFYKYKNNKLQKEIFYSFYNLFEEYFYGWKFTFKHRKKANNLIAIYRSVFTNPKLISVFISLPNFMKKGYIMIPEIVKDVKNKIRKIRNAKNSIVYAYYRKEKIENNKVLVASYFGANISDNIYYMIKDMLDRNFNYDIYVVTNNIKRDRRFIKFNKLNVKLVKLYSKEYLRLLATAKFLICNSRFPSFFSKRNEQIYLNTWHGTPLKTLGKRMLKGIKDIGNNQSNFFMCDYLLYPNEHTKNHIMEDFFLNDFYNGKVVLSGYPRNSIFFNRERALEIRDKLGLRNKKLFAYMPTWRGNTLNTSDVKKYEIEVKNILEQIDKKLTEDTILFVKLHQIVMNKIKISNYKHIRTFHPLYDTYDFLNMVDCLITDYSSVFFDFLNTKKEIVLFAYDYDEYKKDRGTYLTIDDLPFKKIYEIDTLIDFMNNYKIQSKDNTYNYSKIIENFCKYDNFNAAKILNDIVFRNKYDEIAVVENYKNEKKGITICFMPNLNREEEVETFYELVRKHPEYVYVFAQWSFNSITNDILAKMVACNNNFKFIVTQSEMPVTIGEIITIILYRKTKLFKTSVKKIYKRELQRILPNISYKEIINFSKTDKKFIDIANLFKEK